MQPLTPPKSLDSPVDLDTTLQIAADNNASPLDAKEAFWIQPRIQISRWNKMYPYQLLVLRVSMQSNGQASYKIEPGWEFTLPIPPEAFSISMPFATTVHATLGGVIEEHNGAPFRNISLRGTTGVLPGRQGAPQPQTTDFASAIFAGTVAQARLVGEDVTRTISSAINTSPENTNLHRLADFEIDETETGPQAFVAKTSGYYQFRKLQRFFEAYAAMKKTRAGRDLRLAFAMWKEQAVYLVTPVQFDVTRSGESPFEYPFNISFKAWRSVEIDAGGFRAVTPVPIRRDPNALARAMNTMNNARRVVQGVSKMAAAVLGDVDRIIYEPLREGVLMAKDILGLEKTMSDFPDALNTKMYDAYIRAVGDSAAAGDFAREKNVLAKKRLDAALAAANETKDLPRRKPVMVGAASRGKALASHPAGKPIRTNPKNAFETFSKVKMSQLKLDPAIQQQVAEETKRVSNLRRGDFETRRDALLDAHNRLAIAVGAGNAAFEETYGLTNVPAFKDEPTDSDWEVLFALNNSVQAYDALAATADGEPAAVESTMDAMSTLARRSGIAFKVPVAKFAAPFPYGFTLERLALVYLNDATRWHEIAALNGLRAPYVDEVGFDIQMVVNGAGNQIVVPAENDRLHVGQTVYIWSNQARRTRRRIAGLRTIGAQTAVTVDGAPDMVRYKVADAAKLSAFLPDTVNSQSLIYIPSDREPYDDDAITKDIPGVNEFDPMVVAGGVDWLLDSNNDLIITEDGDNRWAVGLTNIIQSIRVEMSVRQGSYIRHTAFGLPLEVGMSGADFDPVEVLAAVRKMFAADQSVVKISSVTVNHSGPRASINAAVIVQGTDRPVPLRFNVDRDFKPSPTGTDPSIGGAAIIPVIVPVPPV